MPDFHNLGTLLLFILLITSYDFENRWLLTDIGEFMCRSKYPQSETG